MEHDIVIIGAGLTGLTTAFHLHRGGSDVIVLEKEARIGGQIRTYSEDGFTFESGPNTGVVSFPEVAELFTALGDETLMETAREESKRRLIWKGGQFHALPSGLFSAVATPLFTLHDKFRILGEPWRAQGTDPDESVGELAIRRLGRSFYDYAVDPFVSGVYAGDPMQLTTRYALPKLYRLEADYGSFVRGSIAKARQPKSDRDRLVSKKVFSARGGLERLIEAMGQSLNVITNCGQTSITPMDDGRWRVSYADGEHEILCRHVVTTVGAYALPQLLPFVAAEQMEAISRLHYAPIVQVSVGVRHTGSVDYAAFGGLVPSREQQSVLGILFPSACFGQRAPEGGALYSYFIGGARHPEQLQWSDDELKRLVCDTMHTMLKYPKGTEPDLVRIFRHQRAIPQYGKDSGRRFEAIAQLERQYPGLTIGGNLRDGIGMGHRISQGATIAAQLLQRPGV